MQLVSDREWRGQDSITRARAQRVAASDGCAGRCYITSQQTLSGGAQGAHRPHSRFAQRLSARAPCAVNVAAAADLNYTTVGLATIELRPHGVGRRNRSSQGIVVSPEAFGNASQADRRPDC